MTQLSVHLLGPPGIERNGEPVQVDTRKATALLAYLALTRERHRRDALVNLLWPEYDQTRGRAALRRTLSALRKGLPSEALDTDRESIGLAPDVELCLDVDQFRALHAQCLAHDHSPSEVCPSCLPLLTEAVALYRGDFMSGFGLRDSYNFDDWQFFQGDALRRELVEVLEKLVQGHCARGELDAALRYARRWLALDRLSESAHVQLIRLYAWSGQRSAALRQYQECARALETQLGVEPEPQTTALYHEILNGQIRAPPGWSSPPRVPSQAYAQGITTPPSEGTSQRPPVQRWQEKGIVTILAADVGSALRAMGDVQPEDEAALTARFFEVVEGALSQYEGRIYRTVGASALAVLGASEGSPELAIRAALDIQRETGAMGLSAAVGIDTGEALRSEAQPDSPQVPALAGTVLDTAMRLATEAGLSRILIGETAYRLTRHAFAFIPAPVDVAGAETPIAAYQVQPGGIRSTESLRADLVGRDEELDRLRRALAAALQGRGHMVSIIGEAGVGKSRLVAELRDIACIPTQPGKAPVPLWLEGRSLGMRTPPSYAPMLDILGTYLGWGAREAESMRRSRISSALDDIVERGDLTQARADEIGPLIAQLFAIRWSDAWQAELHKMDPGQLRRDTFLAIRDLVVALTRQRPVVLVFEDLHWADDLSLDLLSLLMEDLGERSLLMLCLYRPEREHKSQHLGTIAERKCGDQYVELQLRELSLEQSRQMVASLLAIDALPSNVGNLILERTLGNPFYIEEVVRSLIDAETIYREGNEWHLRAVPEVALVPQSVQSVILSRLDHLDDDLRHVLQAASVIGRVFSLRVLAHALAESPELERALWELEERALIYQERTIPEVQYSFKHALTQETAYHNIVREQREVLHRRVAAAIEALYEDSIEEHYEALAHHYELSGEAGIAADYLLRAGEKATRSHANEAAIVHLTRGLELLGSTPETPERREQELQLLISMGVPMVLSRGHAYPGVEDVYSRAWELCATECAPRQRFHILMGLRRFHFMRGELGRAQELGEQLLAEADVTGDPTFASRAHAMQGEVLYRTGEFARAREHSAQGWALYDPQHSRSHVSMFGNDTGMLCHSIGALSSWYLGYPDQALQSAQRAIALADELAHPFTRCTARYFAAQTHRERRDATAVLATMDDLEKISEMQGFALWLALEPVLRGWALVERGDTEEGIEALRRGIAAARGVGALADLVTAQISLAVAYTRVGWEDAAQTLLDETRALVEQNEERCWEAELYRVQGELLAAQGKGAQAEDAYHRAIAVARAQQARSWELRATTSLARLWHAQPTEGSRDRARDLLQGVYDRFDEGFDTADLQEARALLYALT